MSIFVTVGSTGFDLLVQAVISDAFLDAIRGRGFTRLTIQYGNSRTAIDHHSFNSRGIDIELWKYKTYIQAEMQKSDIIISHAGSGTILEALRLHKPLIVVPNPTLLDDHQQEVAHALEALGHLKSSTVCDLVECIVDFKPEEIVPFPQFDGSKFARLVDDEMGFADVTSIIVHGDPEAYEDSNVHAIYDKIAGHFSSTRYKPWPIIAGFLSDLPTGWIGLDAGTGNGKYLSLPEHRPGDIWTIGLDRSYKLLQIAGNAHGIGTKREVVWGNVLHSCWRTGGFDYAISIATIHHLATQERRLAAVQRLLEAVSPHHGRLLIYVWAIEQDNLSRRKIPVNEESSSAGQDVLVPWVYSSTNIDDPITPQIYNRYYHMFAKGELSQLVQSAAKTLGLELGSRPAGGPGKQGVAIVQEGWERSNYYVEVRRWCIL